jgi:deoxycytidylate deaminase
MRRFEERLISKAYALIDMPRSRFKHFSFLVQRTTPICVGWNWKKTHTISKDYRFQSLHAEGHCILAFPHDRNLLHKYAMYNVRINNHGELALAAPCSHCQVLLKSHGIRDVYFTDGRGQFEKFEF